MGCAENLDGCLFRNDYSGDCRRGLEKWSHRSIFGIFTTANFHYCYRKPASLSGKNALDLLSAARGRCRAGLVQNPSPIRRVHRWKQN